MNQKLKYFWNFFVFFIFIYYFHKLKIKSDKKIYSSIQKNFIEDPSILFCVSLDKNCDKNKIKNDNFLKSKLKKVTMKNLICHLNQNIPKNPKLIIEEAEKWNFLDAFQSRLNNTIKKDILMFDYHLCANYDLILDLDDLEKNFSFFFNNINTKVFIYPAKNLNFFSGVSFFTFNFDKNDKKISHIIIKQIKIINSNYEKVCSNNKHQMNLNFCSKIYCNQQCYKKKINDHRFLYTKKDDLVLIENNSTSNPVDHECFNNCFKNFHGYFFILHKTVLNDRNMQSVEFVFNKKVTKIISKRFSEDKIFVLTITNLLNVFLGFTYLKFLLNCLFELTKKLRINKHGLIEKLKIFIIFFVISNAITDCLSLIKIYKKIFFINNSAIFLPNNYSPFSISPCFNVREIIDEYNFNKKQGLNEPFESNSIFVLEKNTLQLEYLLNGTKSYFVTKHKDVDIDTTENHIFYVFDKNIIEPDYRVFKCFLININTSYLTDQIFYPNSDTKKFFFYRNFKFNKYISVINKRFFGCKNYRNNCFSQKECIDKCLVFKYFKKFKHLPSSTPIILDWYEDKQHNMLFFSKNNSKKHKIIKAFCAKKFPLMDCFEKNLKPRNFFDKYALKTTNNYVSVFTFSLAIINSRYLYVDKHELLSNIFTIINIWTGLNMTILSQFFIRSLNKKVLLFINHHLNTSSILNKIFQTGFFLILSFGFLYNLYLLKNETLKQIKLTSVEYKFLMRIEHPIVTICLSLKNKVNFSEKINFTGNLLDKMTFSVDDVFESVNYFDQNFKKKSLIHFNKQEFNETKSFLKISHFYFMKLKCFKLKYKTKIPLYNYYKNQNNSYSLSINLKPSITKYYFTLSSSKTLNFNHFRVFSKKKYDIFFFKVVNKYTDSYIFLKDFTYFFGTQSSVNFNEEKTIYSFLKEKFKKLHNLTTLILPLSKKYFHLTINDKEFSKFKKNEIKKLKKNCINKSHSNIYYLNNFARSDQENENKINLRPNILFVVTKIQDKIPVEYFFLLIMNIISFWFNFSLINISIQLSILFKLFFKIFVFIFYLFYFNIRKLFYYFFTLV